jgi:pimeloyl-ACP methyl ester carboxylesterase
VAVDFSKGRSSFGDPSRPSILFLHGIRLGRAIWDHHVLALAQRYNVVTLDLPGHGALTGVPFTAENLDAQLDEALGTMAAPPLIVGYSLGGYVAMSYAARFPGSTRALLLADCTLDFDRWKMWPLDASFGFMQMLPRRCSMRFCTRRSTWHCRRATPRSLSVFRSIATFYLASTAWR